MSDAGEEDRGTTRLSFIRASAGVAAGLGAAAIGVPGAARAGEEKAIETEPSAAAPAEPVFAYVRDAQRGEVTLVSGTSESTYRDRALVRRMLAAAPGSKGKAGN